MKTRLLVPLACSLVLAALACNAILGIDLPNAVIPDGGGADALGAGDSASGDGTMMADRSMGGDARPDVATDGGGQDSQSGPDADAGVPEAAPLDAQPFDGYCGCSGSGCTPITITAATDPYGIAADPNGVYWTERAASTVQGMEFPGPVHDVVNEGASFQPQGIVLSAGAVFWADELGGNLSTCTRPACNGATILGASAAGAQSIALAPPYLFIGNAVGIYSCAASGCPGGAAAVVAQTSGSTEVAVDPLNPVALYWVHTNLIWTCGLPSCSTATSFSPAEVNPQGLAVANGNLYWAAGTDIRTCSVVDCTAPTSLFPGGATSGPRSVAVDATYVYWTDPQAGVVMRSTLDGLTTTTLASNRQGPSHLALGGTCVFWTENPAAGAGLVMATGR